MAFDSTVVGKQRFLTQQENAASGATVATTDVKSASNVVKALAPVRAADSNSTGLVKLTGSYTGDSDATFDVQITSSTATERRASTPAFIGAGSGSAMTELTVDNTVAAQQFRVTLIDIGTDDQNARLGFFGYWLVSRIRQSGGNSIQLTLDRSGLTATNSGFATPDDMRKDDSRFEGVGFDFGGAFELTAQGELNNNTKRFVLGVNPTVYRQYKTIEAGKQVYYIDPPLTDDIAKGTKVRTVTGTYSATVELSNSDSALTWQASTAYSKGDVVVVADEVFQVTAAGTSGGGIPVFNNSQLGDTTVDAGVTWEFVSSVASETFAGITTYFDLLQALLSSQLVELKGIGDVPPVVIADKTPGGVAAEDPPFITESYFRNFRADGSDGIKKISDIAFNSDGATTGQEISIACTNNDVLGQSRWQVTGTGTGVIGNATEGVPFSATGVAFTIPTRNPSDENDVTQDITNANVQLAATNFAADDGTATTFPQACIRKFGVGPNVIRETLTFTYKKRPDASCDCELVSFSDDLDPNCFGGDQVTVVETVAGFDVNNYKEIPASIQTRIETIRTWHRNKLSGFLQIGDANPSGKSEFEWVSNVALFNNLLNVFEVFLYTMANALSSSEVTQGEFDTAMSSYDTIYTELNTDTQLDLVDMPVASEFLQSDGSTYPIKYNVELQVIVAAAGLIPNPPDTPIESVAASNAACWEDLTTTHWWVVESSEGFAYQPMFTNVPWYAAFETRDDAGNLVYESAKTVGFQLAIGCSGSLTVGDTMTVEIFADPGTGDVRVNRFYQVNDKFLVDVIGESPLELQNGVTGNNTHVWSVIGERDGRLSDYTVINGAESVYSESGIGFKITRGGTPNALNDQWTFSVLANQYQWRKNSDAYSAAADIPDSPVAISDGLSIEFVEGAAVSFEPNDLFSFEVTQPNAPTHLLTPDDDVWRWPDDTPEITIDFGSDKSVSMIAIPWHGIPSTAVISAELLDSGDSVIGSAYPLTWAQDAIYHNIGSTVSGVRKLRLSLTSATDGWIAWVWAGEPIFLNTEADELTIRRSRRMGGNADGAKFHLARGYAGEIIWSGREDDASGWVFEQDLTKLDSMFAYLKANNDEAFAFVPNIGYNKGHMVRLDDDVFEPTDDMAYGLNNQADQVFGASLTFREVFIS